MKHFEFAVMAVVALGAWMAPAGGVYYVKPTGNDGNSGADWNNALRTVSAALARDSAAHVYVASGINYVSSKTVVNGAATIEGVGSGAIICATNVVETLTTYKEHFAVFDVSHADAVLTNLTITTTSIISDTSKAKWYGRCIYLSDGLVVGCTVTNGAPHQSMSPGGGGGVFLTGGTVRACTLASNHAVNKYGNNVYMTGGVVEDCIITNGWCYNSNNVRCRGGGGVYMTGGTLRRSLIAKNSAEESNPTGQGVYMTGGTMAFCTVTAQALGTKTDNRAAVQINGTSVVTNCVLYGNNTPDWRAEATATLENNCTGDKLMPGTGNLFDDPRFVAAAAGDWHVRPGPASGKGCYPDAVGATTPDCGLFLATRGNALESDSVTLGSAITGGAVADTTYAWTVTPQGGGEAQVKSGKGADYATATFTCATGLYDVRLDISVDGVGTDSDTRAGLFRVSAKDIYVAAGVANALTTAASEAGVGSVLHLTNGLYSYTGTLKIDKAFSVISKDGPEKTKIYSTNGGGSTRVVYLTDPGAVLAGVDVTSGNSARGGVLMSAGTVTNCYVCNYTTTSSGPGVNMTGGTLTDCLVTNNVISTHSQYGIAIYAMGACTIQRCRILDNWLNFPTTSAGGSYGTVYLNGASAKILNSLVVGNKARNGAGIYPTGGAVVRNCTVAKNQSLWDADGTKDPGGIYIESKTAATVSDCLKWSNWAKTTECDPTDPGFADGANRDFHLVYGSAAIDAGSGTLADLGPVDLDHLGRFNAVTSANPLPDKGCYEFYESGEIIVAIKDPVHIGTNLSVPYTNEFTLTVAPRSTVVDPANVWWTFDGRTPTAADHDAEGLCVTNVTKKGGAYVANCSVKIDETVYAADAKEFSVIGDKVYLVETNPNAKRPYATWATAATSVAAARECLLAGCEMIVSNGTYQLASSFSVPANATVRSVNGPEVTTFNGIVASPNISLSSGVLSGIRLYGANASHALPGVSMSGGMLTNCIVENATCQNNQAAGLVATGGTVVDCTFKACKPWSGNWATAANLYGNVLMDRCRIVSCGVGDGSSTGQKGALWLQANVGKSPTVRNTLVVGTKQGGCTGIYVSSGFVENCTVVSNASTTAGDTSHAVYTAAAAAKVRNTIVALNADSNGAAANAGGTASCYERCATSEGLGTDPIAGDVKFKDAAKLDFRLRRNVSPCVNAATEQGWMTGAKDLDGNPRVLTAPDVGCYETARAGAAVILR